MSWGSPSAGDVDGDPTGPIELAYGPAGFSVTAAGVVTWTTDRTSDGFVYDGVTHQNLWAYGSGFGSIIDVGDVNGDGTARIAGAGSSSGAVRCSARH